MKETTKLILLAIIIAVLFYPVINEKIFSEKLPVVKIPIAGKFIKKGGSLFWSWWMKEKNLIKRETIKEKELMEKDIENRLSKILGPLPDTYKRIKEEIKNIKNIVKGII